MAPPALICAAGAVGVAAGYVVDRLVHRPGPGRRPAVAGPGPRAPGWAVTGTSGALFALAGARVGWVPALPAALVFLAGLEALAVSDLEQRLLPRRLVYPTGVACATLLVTASAVAGSWGRLGLAAAGGAVAFGLSYAVHAANPRWLGFGDVRLAGLIGAVLGWFGPVSWWVGFGAGDVLAVAVMGTLMALGRVERGTAFPFGAFLAAGAALAVLR